MRLTVKNDAGVVSSAFIVKNSECFHLIINTVYKYIEPDVRTCSKYINEYQFDSEYGGTDWVILEPENTEDEDILNRLTAQMHEKDQLRYIYMDRKLFSGDCFDKAGLIKGGTQ